MNTDIRLSTTCFGHTKIIKLERRLGAEGVLSLIRLWVYTAQNREKGVLHDMTEEDIAIAAGWKEDETKFIETLCSLRLLDKDEWYSIHNWRKHNTYAAFNEVRSEAGRKAAAARWGKDEKNADRMQNDADRMQNDADRNANRIKTDAPVPVPVPVPVPDPSPDPDPSPSPDPDPSQETAAVDESVYAEKSGKRKKERHKTRIPNDFEISDKVKEWAGKHSYNHLEEHLDNFRLKALARGYQYLDWDAAFMTAIREDWAGTLKPATTQTITRQNREDDKQDSIYKLTGGLAGRKNGERSHGNIFDITATATRLD